MVSLHAQNVAQPLKRGDEFLVAAVSSEINDSESLFNGISVLEGWGLRCCSQNVLGRSWGYFAGQDHIRNSDINPKKAAALIAFARGGWGAARLLENEQLWKKGWFLGYSDVSSLLLARLSAGFDGCVHGPLLTSLADEPSWSQERVYALFFGKKIPDLYGQAWRGGVATGPLVVANLTVATHLIGTRYFPDLNGAILILEDIGEEPYRVDRMLTQWRLAGLLQGLVGIGFGDFSDSVAQQNMPEENSFSFDQVLQERSFDLGIPVIGKLPIGHCRGNAALPLGRPIKIDGNKGIISSLV